ncbi:MAG: DMT family transporter [Candidatus Thorarchaeota archaeon]|nr:DMT family transporter [Candidatus Thorarchaeota archaeon]
MILDVYVIGILFALAATMFFGITNIIYKKMSDDISVMDITFSRIWVSLPLAYIFAIASSDSLQIAIPSESMFPLAISMILGILLGDTMYFLSQERIGVSRAFPISMSYPLLVYLITAYFLEEPVIIQRVLGAIIVVMGVGLIARAEYKERSEDIGKWSPKDRTIGFALAFFTMVAWALSDSIFQFGLINVDPADANFYRILVASIILVPFFFLSFKGKRHLPNRRIIAFALMTGLVGIGLSLIAYSYAVKYIGATITAVMIASAPVLTAPLSALYLGEDVNKIVAFGTILTILGVILVIAII